MAEEQDFFVSADWLQKNLEKPGLKIIDGSWYLPAQNRDAWAEYEAGHIPGAIFFDHDEVVDPESTLPHALPAPELFARIAGSMGVAVDDQIVVYDGPGLFSSARTWWIFRVMGARNVKILEGGVDGWRKEGRPLTAEQTRIAPNLFEVDFDAERVASLEDMKHIVETHECQIADARPTGRFTGDDPEPRAGVRGGHMPGARSLPASTLSRDGKLLPPGELRERFAQAGVDLGKPVVTSCGSGVTAAIITLALETLGHSANRLYDGSWAEWGSRSDTPVAKGKA